MAVVDVVRERVTALLRVVRAPRVSVVTPLGWVVVCGSVAAWLLGAAADWVELVLLGATGLLTALLAVVLTVGRTSLRVHVALSSRRVVVGGSVDCRVEIHNAARDRVRALALELPVGHRVEAFDVPTIAGGRSHTTTFAIPTERRGVVVVGPATTVRGDPLGLLRRTVSWTDPVELFVHPVTVAMEPLGTGLLRDLEGNTTAELSMSDLAFHALREFAPGDDRRHIHWRSSAKLATSTQDGSFLVRQYLDTRRAHLALVVDGDAAAYPDPEHFEIAVSAGASIVARAVLDEIDTTVLAAGQVAHGANGRRALDAFSRADIGTTPLSEVTTRAVRVAPDATIVVVVTGAAPSFTELRRAAAAFPSQVRKVVVRVNPDAVTAYAPGPSLTVFTLRALSDLPALFAGGPLQ